MLINDGFYCFILWCNFEDFGYCLEVVKCEIYWIVGGIRGMFNIDWYYELLGNYGEFCEVIKVLGNVNVQCELLVFDVVMNVVGQVVCVLQVVNVCGMMLIVNVKLYNGDLFGLINVDVVVCKFYNLFG